VVTAPTDYRTEVLGLVQATGVRNRDRARRGQGRVVVKAADPPRAEVKLLLARHSRHAGP